MGMHRSAERMLKEGAMAFFQFRPNRRWLVALFLLSGTAGAVIVAVPGLRWRTQLMGMYLAGRIPDLSLGATRHLCPAGLGAESLAIG